MNAIEIESAISELVAAPYNADEFPYQFLRAFGNKETTIKRLREGASTTSDIPNAVLQRNNIHIATCGTGELESTLQALRESPKTAAAKAKFILATDGEYISFEELATGELRSCEFRDLPNHFGALLPLAGISVIPALKESTFDVRATRQLNQLYLRLRQLNPEWESADRSADMNHFMARLIFCYFAEDTGIFKDQALFTQTLQRMSERDGSNTQLVLETLFAAMNTRRGRLEDNSAFEALPAWARDFPYVNGGLFGGNLDVPRFDGVARSLLISIGSLDWKRVNPDIFGSMIQAIADDSERGSLGMHYTSVPNILKVLNPLFLDELRAAVDAAESNPRTLLNIRKRIARIRVFDPACGSGNFLVIAYKELRALENRINELRGEPGRKSDVSLTNFRGIEINHFPSEIARLALIIAEYQCNVQYLGHQEAVDTFLPLSNENWITCGNALRLDWLSVCPPTGAPQQGGELSLFPSEPEHQIVDFENEGGETFICGNPPYLGSTWQSAAQKSDMEFVFGKHVKGYKSIDYVCAWFMKAAEYGTQTLAAAAFVTTNSICQGQQVPILWPAIFATGHEIHFAYTSFKWANLASDNAGVTVAIVGIEKRSQQSGAQKRLFSTDGDKQTSVRTAPYINAYLIAGPNIVVTRLSAPRTELAAMDRGNSPVDGGHLLLSADELRDLELTGEEQRRFVRPIVGSREFINGIQRFCLWIRDEDLDDALEIPAIRARVEGVRAMRLASRDKGANAMASRAHQFREMNEGTHHTLVTPRVSSENRDYLPVGLVGPDVILGDRNFALYDAPLWNLAIIASKLHIVWVGAVCGRLETRFSYSNTLGWNTFPVPKLSEDDKAALTRCAENILLAREAHFPATIADLYDPEKMLENLRQAHEENDDTLERIYIGRRFRNDTERLEKLFEMYAKMSAAPTKPAKKTTTRKKAGALNKRDTYQ